MFCVLVITSSDPRRKFFTLEGDNVLNTVINCSDGLISILPALQCDFLINHFSKFAFRICKPDLLNV